MFRPAGCSPPNFTVTSQLQKSSDPKLNAAVVDDDDGPGRATERFRCENSFTSMGLVVGWCCCCCFCVVGTVLPLTTTRTEDTKTCGSLRSASGRKVLRSSPSAHSSSGWLWLLSCCCCCCGVVALFQRFQCGEQQSAHTHDVVGSRFHAESHFTRSGERGRKNKNCVVAQTNRRGEGRRTFENQISGVQHFASATD